MDTGRVDVLRLITAVDAGRAINPLLLEGQVEGGAVMAQGYALLERCHFRDGMPADPSLESCGVPTACDAAPSIETVVVESAQADGPFGARGVGEITMIAVVPALTAAIHSATGVWIDELPAVPERVLAALRLAADTAAPAPTPRTEGVVRARHRPRPRR
jgi:CO/xanthine dehydrogenase Mo-binding subunit